MHNPLIVSFILYATLLNVSKKSSRYIFKVIWYDPTENQTQLPLSQANSPITDQVDFTQLWFFCKASSHICNSTAGIYIGNRNLLIVYSFAYGTFKISLASP